MGRLALVVALALAGCAGPVLEVDLRVDDVAEVAPEARDQPAHWLRLHLPEVGLSATLALGDGVTECSLTPDGEVWRVRWTDRARKVGTLYLSLRDSETLALFDPAAPARRNPELDDPVLGSLVACNRPEVLGEHFVVGSLGVLLVLLPGGDYAPRHRFP